LSDWQEKKGDFWSADIKGIGPTAAEAIADAMEKYWTNHPRLSPVPVEGLPAAVLAPPATDETPASTSAPKASLPSLDDVVKVGIASDLPPDTTADLFIKAVPYCISHPTITAEGLHRHLDIPLRNAIKLIDTLKATGYLADEGGKLVCKVTAEQWAAAQQPAGAAA
jgi:hypothetical protein